MNVSRIYLLNVSEEVRSELNGVKYESVEYIENLMKCDTISFTVDKYIDIDGTYVDSNYYDQIKESMYVYVSNLNNSNENNDGSTLYKNRGLFRISEVSISNNGHNESKSVTCESSECELGNQSLFGFKINTGELDSAEYLADDNVDEATKLAIEYVTFYNANNSQLSLLDLAIEKVPYWSIGYVDPLLRNKKFSFSIDNKPIYSFLINELSSTAQCVFTFDTINRTINAYSISRVDALGDTNIFVSYRNLLNSTNITRSDMDLVTRFNVSGSDNLSIARVNFDEPYIENLTHLLSDEDKHDNPIYSNSGLRDKYLAWYSYRYGLGGARDTFVQKVKKYNENIVALDELKNKLPVDALDVNQYKDFDKETLQNLLANYMSIINAMVIDFAAYYDDGTMVVDENGFAVIDDQQGLEESIYWEDYQLYKNILIPNIKVAIQNCDLDEEHQLPYNTNYETDWDLYGIVELENKIKVYKQNIDVLKEAGYQKAWSDLTPAEKAKWEQATYNIYHQQYLDYLDLLDDAEDALHDRRVDYQGISNEQDLLLTQIATIKENASIENPNFGFTQNELLTIYKLRRDTDYLNDNILSTSDDDIVSQIDDMNELFEAAMDELDIVSQHQYKLSVTLDNLFNLEAFQGYKKDLKAGNFIKMFLREADEMTEVNYGLEDSSTVGLYTSNDDKPMLTHERYNLTPNIVKLRVTSIKRNPCLEDDNSLTLEFSNMIRDKDGLSDYTNLFKSAVNSAFNQINATVQQKLDYTNVAISNSIIKALVSSSALGKRINSLIADTIQAKDGIFDTVQSQYISTDEFEARLARVQSLSASSAFFQFMETNFATVHELDVEVARIDTLVASDANIRNILAGNIGTGSLQTIHLTGQNVVIDDAIITSAMIQGLSASKILAGTIYTSLVKIANDQNENLLIDGATIQIKDSNNTVRVQIGRDAGGDYNYSLWNENGDLMWDAAGIYETGIHDGVIRDVAVADDANINAKKLDLPSLVTRLNEDGSLTVQTSQIIIDEAGQTFEARFKEITSFVDNYNNKTVMVVPLEDVNGNPLYDSNGNLLYVEVKLKDFDFLAYTNYIKEQMDSRIETWYQSTDPSLNWNEAELAEHKGDLWFNTTNNTTWRWNGTSWSEQSAPDAVFDAIDGKAQIFIATPTTPYHVGDLWFNSATSDIMTCTTERLTGNYNASDWEKRNKYTDDSSLTTFLNGTYASTIQSIQNQIDGKIDTWYQEQDPSLSWESSEYTKHTGDLWYKPSDSTTKRWNGTQWTEQSAPKEVFDAIDGKAQIFIQQPTVPYNEGDLWFDSSTSDIMTCVNTRTTGNYTASDWQKRNKYTDDSSLTTFISTTYATQIQNLQGQIDGKIQTWYQDTDPSTAWTTSAIKNQHIGDLWYVTNDVTSSGTVLFTKGDTYRYDLDNNVYKWMKQSAPQEVFDKIDGKAQIFISQPTTPYHVGDLWFNSATSDIMTCTTERLTGNYNASDWEKRNKYTDDTAANAAQSDVNGLKTRTTTLETDLAVVKGQITSKIWQTDIDTAINGVEGEITTISDNYTTLTQRVDGIDIDIGSIQTSLTTKADNSTVLEMNEKILDIEQNVDGVRISVSESVQRQEAIINNLEESVKNIENKTIAVVQLQDSSENDIYDGNGYSLYVDVKNKDFDFVSYLSGIQNQIDGKIDTFYQSTDPSVDWNDEYKKQEHIGDLWFKTTDSTTWRWNGASWDKQDAPDDVFDKIDGKAKIFTVQPTPPYNVGDLWFAGTNAGIMTCITARTTGNFNQNDWQERNKYTDDSSLNTFISTTYNDDISELQGLIDGKIETFYGDTDPSTAWTTTALVNSHDGDLWYDTTNGSNVTKRWNAATGQWVAQNAPKAVFDAIDGKAQVFVSQPTPPYAVGDLWFNSATSDIMTCVTTRSTGNYTASDWEKRNKYTDDSALTTFLNGDYATTISAIRGQIDNKIETYYGSTDPSSAWTTTTLKNEHKGDLWYDTANNSNITKRWNGTAWVNQNAPKAVFDAIDGKSNIFVHQPTVPYNEGDLWVLDANDIGTGKAITIEYATAQGIVAGDILTCNADRSSGNYTQTEWVKKVRYTDDSELTSFLNGSYASTISEIRGQIDSKIDTYYQNTNPATSWSSSDYAEHEGDLWYATDDVLVSGTVVYSKGNTYRWTKDSNNQYSWAKQTAPQEVFDKIDGKAQVFVGTSVPTPPYNVKDIWFNGTVIKVCKTARSSGTGQNSDWEKKDTYTDDSALTTFISGQYATDKSTLEGLIDGKIDTFYGSTDPSTNWPSSEYSKHEGDLWYKTTDSTTWRWSGSAWVEQSAPNEVFNKINGKAKIFISQPSVPYNVGDLWFNSSTSDILTCVKAKTSSQSYDSSDWQKRNKYTDDTTANAAQQDVNGVKTRTTTLESKVEVIEGQITSKVWQTDIDESVNEFGEQVSNITNNYSTIVQNVEGVQSTVGALVDVVDEQGNKVFKYVSLYDSSNVLIYASDDKPLDVPVLFKDMDMSRYTSGVESSIKQNADNIELKVSSDGVIAAINASLEGITIQASKLATITASKIALEGYTTINQHFTIDQNGNMNAVDGTFSGSITSTNGQIGNWHIGATSIYSGSAVWKNSSGMYFGEQGISLSDKFYVDDDGNMTAESATVRGKIFAEYLELSEGVTVDVSRIDGLSFLLKATLEGLESRVQSQIDDINNKKVSSRPLYDTNGNNSYELYDANGYLIYGSESYEEADLASNIDTMWSSIIQNSENIELKVSRNGIISAINLSSEQASIQASKISIEGLTTINNYFKVNTDGSMECIGGKIGGLIIDSTSVHAAYVTGSVTADNCFIMSSTDFTRSINGTPRSGLRFAIGTNFGVSNSGTLYASGATISGTITADSLTATNSGTIANWNINSSCLYYGNANFKNSGGIYLGTVGISVGDVFWVDKTNGTAYFKGSVNATSLTLGAGAIDYNSNIISNKPSLSTVATSGSYNDLSSKPSLSTVATSGSYNDLSSKPNLSQYLTQSDLNGYVTTTDLGNYYKIGVGKGTDSSGYNYFYVSSQGLLKARNAVIYGTIYASNGTFGGTVSGATINSSTINSGTIYGSTIRGIDEFPDVHIYDAILHSPAFTGYIETDINNEGYTIYTSQIRALASSNSTCCIRTENDNNCVDIRTTKNAGLFHDNSSGYSTSGWLIYIQQGGSIKVNTTSDRRQKKNINNMTDKEARALLSDITPVNFNYINDDNKLPQCGFIAQEVRDALIKNDMGCQSYMLIYDKDTQDSIYDLNTPEENVTYGLDYSKFIPVLWKGWQILNEKCQRLEQRISELES